MVVIVASGGPVIIVQIVENDPRIVFSVKGEGNLDNLVRNSYHCPKTFFEILMTYPKKNYFHER